MKKNDTACMCKVKILIPMDWSNDDWDLFQTMLNIYVEGWKRQAGKPKKEAKTQGDAS